MSSAGADPLFQSAPKHIALIGNSVPRRCGIATFTSDTLCALKARFPDLRVDLYAMDDGAADLPYDPDVNLIAQHDVHAYAKAARDIVASGAEAIWLQHEYGIFGGSAGDHILRLLARANLPLLTTLHTVLEKPNPEERRVLDALAERSARLIVMAEKGRDILRRVYDIPDRQIAVIPHGVPDRPYVAPDSMKARFGFEGRKTILTFGLLAPDKGIEHMIRAMPEIVRAVPEALYIVLGASHPNLLRHEGEAHREMLQTLAESLGVADNVRFLNEYVALDALLDYLAAADVYVTPYNNPAQITSGTLSYAVSLGKPVVSTPYVHATEILADGHGVLVPFRDPHALADAVGTLLRDDGARTALAERAYDRGRTMIWSRLAERGVELLGDIRRAEPARMIQRDQTRILKPDLSGVLRMSDATGMLQHSIYSVPDRRHGYCVDDNARALILMSQIDDLDETFRDQWTSVYGSFVQHSWNPDRRRFRNFMRFDRSWCEEEGSEDSSGRALWSLGVTARDAHARKHREWATNLFDQAAPHSRELGSPRANAFVILGAAAMHEAHPGHALSISLMEEFGARLHALVVATRRPDWAWFETVLAYDNARLPEALIRAGQQLGRQDFIDCGIETLRWIDSQTTTSEGRFRAVGTDSFGHELQPPMPFDQQPLEAQAMVEACAAAYAVTGDFFWMDRAEAAYRWYLGANDLDLPLATVSDGGCFDGLMPDGVNRNQGAESILALQLASCAIIRLCQSRPAMAEALGAVA